jgi:hypothetical protein
MVVVVAFTPGLLLQPLLVTVTVATTAVFLSSSRVMPQDDLDSVPDGQEMIVVVVVETADRMAVESTIMLVGHYNSKY